MRKIEVNPKLVADFKKYMENENNKIVTKPYTPYVSTNSNVYGNVPQYGTTDYVTIYFYEWSSLDNKCRIYHSLKSFFNFLDECNIQYNEIQKKELDKRYLTSYCTCLPNHSILLVASSHNALKCTLNNLKNANI